LRILIFQKIKVQDRRIIFGVKMDIPNQVCKWAEREIESGRSHPAKVLTELGSMVLKLWKNQQRQEEYLKKRYQHLLRPDPQEKATQK
jgi:hypothetical protein